MRNETAAPLKKSKWACGRMKWVERTPKVKIHNEKHGASHSGDAQTGCATYIAIQKACDHKLTKDCIMEDARVGSLN